MKGIPRIPHHIGHPKHWATGLASPSWVRREPKGLAASDIWAWRLASPHTQDQPSAHLLEGVGGTGRASQVVLQNVCEEREGLSTGPICVCMQLRASLLSSSLPACVWASTHANACQRCMFAFMCSHILTFTHTDMCVSMCVRLSQDPALRTGPLKCAGPSEGGLPALKHWVERGSQ